MIGTTLANTGLRRGLLLSIIFPFDDRHLSIVL
jgi:hypothetical protein